MKSGVVDEIRGVGAGLYQINVVVPAVGSGDQPIVAAVGGTSYLRQLSLCNRLSEWWQNLRSV